MQEPGINGSDLRRKTNESLSPTKLTGCAQDAVAALNGLQSNHATIDAIRKTGQVINKQAIPEMIDWCRRIGYEVHNHRLHLGPSEHS